MGPKIYLDYTQEELDRQYEHRSFVPDGGCPLVVGFGSPETDEFQRQGRTFAAAWAGLRPAPTR